MEMEHATGVNTAKVKRGCVFSSVGIVSSMAHFFGVLIFIYTVYLAKPGFSKYRNTFYLEYLFISLFLS